MNVLATMFAAVLATAALAGCATSYAPMQLTGGYQEKELQPGVWRVTFAGNGYTTRETVQTFWLYRSAELAKAKGFDGFRILTPMNLAAVRALRPADADAPATIIRVHGGGGGHGGGGHYTYYSYSYRLAPKPVLSGDIELIRKPILTVPGRIFDASALLITLDPYVKGRLCGSNVCPHAHVYLHPAPLPGPPMQLSPAPAPAPPPPAAPIAPPATPS